MQLLTPKWVQFLHSIIIPQDAFGVILKHPWSMLHLGFFAVLARGLKKATILLTSVLSLPAAADLHALTAGMQGFLVKEAGETTSNTTTSSFSMSPGGEGSVVGDWNGGKEGWVKSALVGSADIVGLVTVIVMSGMMFGWSKDLLLMTYEELYLLWHTQSRSFIKMLSIWMKETIIQTASNEGHNPGAQTRIVSYSNTQHFPFLPASQISKRWVFG